MLDEQKYNVIYAGAIAQGFNATDVKAGFVSQMKIPEDKIEQLFSGKRVILKKALNNQKASQLQQKLLKIGAEVVVVPSVSRVAPKLVAEQSELPLPAEKTTHSSNLSEYDEDMNARILKAKAMIASQQLEQQIAQDKEPNPVKKLLTLSGVLGIVMIFLYYYVKSMV